MTPPEGVVDSAAMEEKNLVDAWGDFLSRAMALVTGTPGELEVLPLKGDGSGRAIYRVTQAGQSAIAMRNPHGDNEIDPEDHRRFIALRERFAAWGVRVPALYAVDPERGYLLVEDLGDRRLFDLARDAAKEERLALYLAAIQQLALIHAHPFPQRGIAPNPDYSVDFILAHEAGYFHRELVLEWAGLNAPFGEIETDCRRLAEEAQPKAGFAVCMHRDYQSRNLMILGEGSDAAVIDFQGARSGPAEYDLAALLFDPYVELGTATRLHLMQHYLAMARQRGVPDLPFCAAPTRLDERALLAWWANGRTDFEFAPWRMRFLANSANRIMQALGAFAKLGGRLGRPGFLEYIPAALARLSWILSERGDAVRLHALVRRLQARSPD